MNPFRIIGRLRTALSENERLIAQERDRFEVLDGKLNNVERKLAGLDATLAMFNEAQARIDGGVGEGNRLLAEFDNRFTEKLTAVEEKLGEGNRQVGDTIAILTLATQMTAEDHKHLAAQVNARLLDVYERLNAVDGNLSAADTKVVDVAAKLAALDDKIVESNRQAEDASTKLTSALAAIDGKIVESNRQAEDASTKLTSATIKIIEDGEHLTQLNAKVTDVLQQLTAVDEKLLATDAKLVEVAGKLAEVDDKMVAGRSKMLEGDGALSRVNETLSGIDRKLTEGNGKLIEAGMQLQALVRRGNVVDITDEPGSVYTKSLRVVGVLNYENDVVSGERLFLSRYIAQFPEATIFDVGANTGQYAALARELGSRAAIHSFEPHPRSFQKLTEAASRLKINAHPIALGETRSEIELYDYADEAGSQHASVYRDVIEGVHRRAAAAVKVRCETLDFIVGKLGIKNIGLLKVDTEGHELAVLKGARKLLKSKIVDVIQFEFNEMNVISRVFMKDFFDILPGYRIYRLLPDEVIEFQVYDPTFMEVFAYQNMVCIRRDLDPYWIHTKR